MKNCYLCGVLLSESNSSIEHIILNSIGGHLKSTSLLCKDCNSKLGYGCDAELAKQLSFLAGLLQVKRDDGATHPIIKGGKLKTGEEYYITGGSTPVLSKPTVNISNKNSKLEIKITARDKKELKRILTGIKSKYKLTQMDIDSIVDGAIIREKRLDEPLTYNETIGGDLAFQSIVKTAINFYIFKRNEKAQVEHLFNYLTGKETKQITTHFYTPKSIYPKAANEIIHLIHLVGDKHSKLLYCYIEFFSAYSFLVLLSDHYSNNSFKETYCYDINSNREANKQVNLKITKEDFNLWIHNNPDYDAISKKITRVLNIIGRKQYEHEQTQIIENCFDKVWAEHKGENVWTKQIVDELSNLLAIELTKLYMQR